MMNTWFGRVRTKWPVVPLREVAHLGTGHTPSREKEEYWQNCDIPWVTVEDIRKHGLYNLSPLEETVQHISQLGLENSAAVLHPKGTVMLSRTASIGLSCITGKAMATTQAFVTWTAKSQALNPRYLHAALKAMEQQYNFLAYGATHLTIYFPDIKTLRIPLPTAEEQVEIVDFLDRETAKIDALIAEQQRLIELLQEKRQAVISHAVTKGLNPNAPMKDSGVEWMGEVPEHWEVCKIKHKCTLITDGAHISPETEGGTHLFVSTKDIKEGSIDFDNALRTTASSYEYLVKTGCKPQEFDILFSKDGTIGRTAMAPGGVDFVVASSLIILRPNKEVASPAYLDYACQSNAVGQQVESMVKGAGLPRLSISNLLRVFSTFPPISEQEEIAKALSLKIGSLTKVIRISRNAVSLLQERRSALISAAVTGQIDVRGLATEEEP